MTQEMVARLGAASGAGQARGRSLREGFFLDLLHNHYRRDEARAQLGTAIDWDATPSSSSRRRRGELRLPRRSA